MGVDILCHVEVKIHGTWHHYSVVRPPTNYDWFSRMSGAYGQFKPVVELRGLPADATLVTNIAFQYDDGKLPGWLTATEATEMQEWYEKNYGYNYPPLFGYLFGGYLDSFLRYPKDYRQLIDMGLEDARLIFWFDS